MRFCGFCVRPVNFAGISFVALGRGSLTSYSTLQNNDSNTDPCLRIMVPQSSMDCSMKGIEEHILGTFSFCSLNHMPFFFLHFSAGMKLKCFILTHIQNLIGVPFILK